MSSAAATISSTATPAMIAAVVMEWWRACSSSAVSLAVTSTTMAVTLSQPPASFARASRLFTQVWGSRMAMRAVASSPSSSMPDRPSEHSNSRSPGLTFSS